MQCYVFLDQRIESQSQEEGTERGNNPYFNNSYQAVMRIPNLANCNLKPCI